MRTCRLLGLCAIVSLTFSAGRAYAKISDTTRSLQAGQLSLGAEFQAGLADGTPLGLNLHEEIGLRSGLDLVLDQQLRVSEGDGVLLAAGVKWTFLANTRKSPGLALWLTGFFDTGPDDAGFRGHFMVDNTWGKFTPYLALDLDIFFGDDTNTIFSLIGGTRVGLVKNVAAFFEGGFSLDEDDQEFLSAGIRITL
ncbi:MAG: hypothetical protein AAF654_13425 [Myxococcota bacterium]